MPSRLVGRVTALYRYPVKSMAAETLETADVSWQGIAGDRRWGFVRPGVESSNFPWMSIRQRSDMGSFRASFVDPADPEGSAIQVVTPAGETLSVSDPRLAAELGDGVRVIKQNRGVFDWLPLSLMTTQTVAGIGALVGRELDVLRFRPNLVIEAADDAPAFPEDAWVGATLAIGGLTMRIDERDSRCVMINVDPASSERDPAVLKAVAQDRDACLGVYGSTVSPGPVRVGDAVMLVEPPTA